MCGGKTKTKREGTTNSSGILSNIKSQQQGNTIGIRRRYNQQNNNSGLSNNIKLSSPPNQGMGLTSDFLAQWIPSDDDFESPPSPPPTKKRPNQGMWPISDSSGSCNSDDDFDTPPSPPPTKKRKNQAMLRSILDSSGSCNSDDDFESPPSLPPPIRTSASKSITPPKERPNQGMTITQVSGDQLGLDNASVISPINSQKRSTSLSTPFQQLQQQGGPEHSIGIRMPYKQQNNNPNNDSSSLSDFDTPPPSSKKRNMGPIPKKRPNQGMTITQVSGDPLDSYNASVQSLLSNIPVSSYTSSPRGTSIYKDVDLSKNKDVIKSPRRLLEELSPGIYNNIEGHTANVRYQVHSGNYLRDRIFTFPFSSGTRGKNYPETIQWPKNELDKYNNYLLPQKDLGKNDSEMKGIRKVKEFLPNDFSELYTKSNDPNMNVTIEMQTYYNPCITSILPRELCDAKTIQKEYELPYYFTVDQNGSNLKKYNFNNNEIKMKEYTPKFSSCVSNRGVGCEYELLKTPEKINNMASAVTNNNQNLNLKVKSNILVKNANDGGINYY